MVHTWDMRMRRCLHRDVDEGCLTAAALAVAPSGRLYATGADSGVVNVYRRDGPLGAGSGSTYRAVGPGLDATEDGEAAGGPARPYPARAAAPARAITNLTTVADTLAFSPDSQARPRAAAWL